MRFEIDMDDEFMRTFCNAGVTDATCNCGRNHIAMLLYDEWDQNWEQDTNGVGTIKDNLEEEAKGNNMIILDYETDYLDIMEIDGKVFVAGCECEGWKPYMNFMIAHRSSIAKFLIKTSKEIKRVQAYEEVMDVLEKEYE